MIFFFFFYSLPSRRFPVEDIPDDEQECANWLHKLYQEKVSWGENAINGLICDQNVNEITTFESDWQVFLHRSATCAL